VIVKIWKRKAKRNGNNKQTGGNNTRKLFIVVPSQQETYIHNNRITKDTICTKFVYLKPDIIENLFIK